MTEPFAIPVLGLGAEDRQPYTVVWKSGELLFRGLLGNIEDELELLAAKREQETRNDELRSQGITILADYK